MIKWLDLVDQQQLTALVSSYNLHLNNTTCSFLEAFANLVNQASNTRRTLLREATIRKRHIHTVNSLIADELFHLQHQIPHLQIIPYRHPETSLPIVYVRISHLPDLVVHVFRSYATTQSGLTFGFRAYSFCRRPLTGPIAAAANYLRARCTAKSWKISVSELVSLWSQQAATIPANYAPPSVPSPPKRTKMLRRRRRPNRSPSPTPADQHNFQSSLPFDHPNTHVVIKDDRLFPNRTFQDPEEMYAEQVRAIRSKRKQRPEIVDDAELAWKKLRHSPPPDQPSQSSHRAELDRDEHAQPESAKPESAQPEPTQPESAKLEPTQPEPTQPEPTQPEPTQSEPAQLEPTQPEPTQPEPTQPEPTQPEPAQSEPEKGEPAEFEPAQPEVRQPKAAQPEQAEPRKPQHLTSFPTRPPSSSGSQLPPARPFPDAPAELQALNPPLIKTSNEAVQSQSAPSENPDNFFINPLSPEDEDSSPDAVPQPRPDTAKTASPEDTQSSPPPRHAESSLTPDAEDDGSTPVFSFSNDFRPQTRTGDESSGLAAVPQLPIDTAKTVSPEDTPLSPPPRHAEPSTAADDEDDASTPVFSFSTGFQPQASPEDEDSGRVAQPQPPSDTVRTESQEDTLSYQPPHRAKSSPTADAEDDGSTPVFSFSTGLQPQAPAITRDMPAAHSPMGEIGPVNKVKPNLTSSRPEAARTVLETDQDASKDDAITRRASATGNRGSGETTTAKPSISLPPTEADQPFREENEYGTPTTLHNEVNSISPQGSTPVVPALDNELPEDVGKPYELEKGDSDHGKVHSHGLESSAPTEKKRVEKENEKMDGSESKKRRRETSPDADVIVVDLDSDAESDPTNSGKKRRLSPPLHTHDAAPTATSQRSKKNVNSDGERNRSNTVPRRHEQASAELERTSREHTEAVVVEAKNSVANEPQESSDDPASQNAGRHSPEKTTAKNPVGILEKAIKTPEEERKQEFQAISAKEVTRDDSPFTEYAGVSIPAGVDRDPCPMALSEPSESSEGSSNDGSNSNASSISDGAREAVDLRE